MKQINSGKEDRMDSLMKTFGITSFRASQEEIIETILKGEHCLVLMPTGMGKSLCYQLPALMLPGLTVVISPLIALMKDQVDGLKARGVDAVYINSSLGTEERSRRYKGLAGGKYRIIYVSPERFRKKEFLDAIKTRSVSLLALDEAHCVSRWGSDFRPDYSRVAEFREVLGDPVTVALTATATSRVQQDIVAQISPAGGQVRIFNEGICRPNLHLSVEEVIDDNEKYEIILKNIRSEKGAVIIYFSLIKSLDAFAAWLEMKKISFNVYHGKLSPERRRSAQKRFLSSESSLMLATNAFGMGIDKADIRMIIHADIPDSVESYYQEIGRAGRDGKPSKCKLLYCESDLAVQMDFLHWRNPDGVFIKKTYDLIKGMGQQVNSYTYEELQEKLVYKHAADHRLQTVLNLFDRHGVTSGSMEGHNLKIIDEVPEELLSKEYTEEKLKADRMRLYDMLQYVKNEKCRREYINRYFGLSGSGCDNCDLCDNS